MTTVTRKDALERMNLAAAILAELKKTPLSSRELSIALTELETAILWVEADMRRNPHEN